MVIVESKQEIDGEQIAGLTDRSRRVSAPSLFPTPSPPHTLQAQPSGASNVGFSGAHTLRQQFPELYFSLIFLKLAVLPKGEPLPALSLLF